MSPRFTTRTPFASVASRLIIALVLIGTTGFGVQALRASAVDDCPTLDPIEICLLGGTPLCETCCEQNGHPEGGECALGTTCLCY